MKKIIVIGGTGAMGSVVVRDLYETWKDGDIIVAARDGAKAKAYACSFRSPRVRGVRIDVADRRKTVRQLRGATVVVNCAQYTRNLDVMAACLDAGVHYIDLGGMYHMTKKQLRLHSHFKQKKIIGILGCGSTPGITNIMVAYGATFLDKVKEIHISFGDADVTKYRQPFVLPYSMQTLVDEFTKPAAVFMNGRIRFVPATSGKRTISFPRPVGAQVGYYVLHSELATLPRSFHGKGLRACSFRATFPKSFVKEVQSLIRPKDATATVMNQSLSHPRTKINDLEYLRVELHGRRRGKPVTVVVYCLTKSQKKWNIPAGTYDTAVPASIIAQLTVRGAISQTGVYPPETIIDPGLFFAELRKRNIKVYKK